VAALMAGLSFGIGNASAQNTTIHGLTYAGWWNDGTGGGGSSTDFTNAEADSMYTAANTAVQTDNDGAGTGDIACDHGLFRSGNNLGLHGNGSDGDIGSQAEFNYVNSGAVFVKVVPAISWCGSLASNIAGCTATGGLNSIILAEWALSGTVGGIVAAHEFGHATGLSHSTATSNVMLAAVSSSTNRVTTSQCTSMKNDHVDTDGPGGNPAPGIFNPAVVAARTDFSGVPIEEVAHSIFVDSAPAEVADYYGAADLAKLKAMLGDTNEAPYHGTIAMLIGLLSSGSDADAVTLSDYAAANAGTPAGRAALMSLGDVAARGSKAALATLVDAAGQGSSAAVGGLGLSGKADGLKKLRSLKGAARANGRGAAPALGGPVGGVASAAAAVDADSLDEAIAANQAIASRGRRAYYGR
jgi:hypothetical protein